MSGGCYNACNGVASEQQPQTSGGQQQLLLCASHADLSLPSLPASSSPRLAPAACPSGVTQDGVCPTGVTGGGVGVNGVGSGVVAVTSDVIKSVKPYATQDEYLYAMKEDLADWLNTLYQVISSL